MTTNERMDIFQEGLPVRLMGIHVLNTSSLIDKILMLLKPFMKKELLSMVNINLLFDFFFFLIALNFELAIIIATRSQNK